MKLFKVSYNKGMEQNSTILTFNSYKELIDKAPSIKSNCILRNLNLEKMKDILFEIDLTYQKPLEVILDVNVELYGDSKIALSGSNYTIMNLKYIENKRNLR